MKTIRDVLKKYERFLHIYYYGENGNILGLFNELIEDFKSNIITDNLESINYCLSLSDNTDEIKELLNASKDLEEKSLRLIDEIHNLIEDMMGFRLVEARQREPLRFRLLRLVY
jgi:hypothetical protein